MNDVHDDVPRDEMDTPHVRTYFYVLYERPGGRVARTTAAHARARRRLTSTCVCARCVKKNQSMV